jgi:hypothetical protein
MEKFEEENLLINDFSNITLNGNECKINKEVKLKEFIIISKYFEQNEEDKDNNSKEISLPTGESLQRLCNSQLVKEFVNFDLEKYKSNFELNQNIDKNKNKDSSSDEKLILNLDKILSTEILDIIPYVLIFLGGINSDNSIYDFFDDSIISPDYECFVDYNVNYLEYLNKVIDYLKKEKRNDNIYFKYHYLEPFFNSLEKLGVVIKKENKNIIYRNLKDSILFNEKNKILILIAPSQNFWIKSENKSIGNRVYDKQLNNYTYIYYNDAFIRNYYEKVVKHIRCQFGLISSMIRPNIKSCFEGLKIKCHKNISGSDPIIIDQACHDSDDRKTYNRNMKKIIEYLKQNDFDCFDERNILILEDKKHKIRDTKNNSINVNVFNEDYIREEDDKKIINENEGNKVIKYIVDLLENCDDDIRQYIKDNKLS